MSKYTQSADASDLCKASGNQILLSNLRELGDHAEVDAQCMRCGWSARVHLAFDRTEATGTLQEKHFAHQSVSGA